MKKARLLFLLVFIPVTSLLSQTLIPNGGFEDWTSFGSFSNPSGWDTPNEELMAIPFFGSAVVSKSTDHQSGSFSARLESKHITIPPLDAPGFMITATFSLDISTMAYTITGGVPINDQPTHLKGFYKYIPKGGDSCIIGIGLFKHINGYKDTIAHAEFSTKDTVTDWMPFSAWIDYDTVATPDTMQVYAFSTAQEVLTPGTVLYVDDLYLDYTVGVNEQNSEPIIYNDKETSRLIVFPTDDALVSLFNMQGREVSHGEYTPEKDRIVVHYGQCTDGMYILRVVEEDQVITRTYFLGK
jgi:hypothetical protein